MRDFGEWFANPEPRVKEFASTPAPAEDPIAHARDALEAVLPDDVRIRFEVPCRMCGRRYEFLVEIELYDPDTSYCGGSPRCYP
jgi:hypothetical protein